MYLIATQCRVPGAGCLPERLLRVVCSRGLAAIVGGWDPIEAHSGDPYEVTWHLWGAPHSCRAARTRRLFGAQVDRSADAQGRLKRRQPPQGNGHNATAL